MNVRELRAIMDAALCEEGFQALRLLPRRLTVWSIPGEDIVRYFCPHAYRRPWGFRYSGAVGIEIPALREWLSKYKPGDTAGIFHTDFVGYHLANEKVLGRLVVQHGDPVPADLWAGLLMDRLLTFPASLEALVDQYRCDPMKLGLLAGPFQKPAWDFLVKWLEYPHPALRVPRRQPDGRIV